jgi:hypothetical protein
MKKNAILAWSDQQPLNPSYAQAAGVDLVVIRWREEERVSVLNN